MSDFKRPDVLKITGVNQKTGKEELFEFDPYCSTVHLLRGDKKIKIEIPPNVLNDKSLTGDVRRAKAADKLVEIFTPDNPIKKKPSEATFILIRMGSKCNYKCTYCAQTLCSTDDEDTIEKSTAGVLYADKFIETFPTWFNGGVDGKGKGVSFMFIAGIGQGKPVIFLYIFQSIPL